MRHLAVGDIHGCSRALQALAAIVPFRPDDVLVTLSYHVDRGPDSCAVLDRGCLAASAMRRASTRGHASKAG